MGLLESIRASASETRDIGGVPWRPWDSPLWRFDIGGPVHPSRSVFGPDKALGLPALYAGAKLLADSTASIPLRKYTGEREGKHTLYTGPSVLDRPSVVGTRFDWIFSCMSSLVLQGNAWGYITGKDKYGYPTGIEWIPPEDVVVQEAEKEQSWNPLKARVFVYGRETPWYGPNSELFHVTAFKLPGRLEGISLLKAFALTITAGHEAQQYGTSWYQNGGFPIGTFQNTEIEINSEQSAEIRQMLVASMRRRQPLVYGRDWDYKPVTVPPEEAQFIETLQLNATQIAAILGLPAIRLGGSTNDSLHYSTSEQDTLQIIEAMRPWLVRLEEAFFDLMPRQRFTKFYTDALLKTDLEARMSIYQIQRNIGFRTADELRELEDLPPLPGGVGAEALPLTLMNALGTRAGAIPKSLLKSVVLEMDIAANRLEKLEKTYVNVQTPVTNAQGQPTGQTTTQKVPIGQPMATPPFTQDPASFLAGLVGIQRDASQPYEARVAAQALLGSILQRAENMEGESGNVPATDLLAPWMHDTRSIVLDH